MNISEMTPTQLLTEALNHPIARNFIGMVALQLEGVGSINPKAVRAGVMKVAATLNNEATPYTGVRERQPTVQPISRPLTQDEGDAALADHQLNTTMRGREIEANREAHEDQMFTTDDHDRMTMIEF